MGSYILFSKEIFMLNNEADTSVKMSREMKDKIFINPEHVIVNLIKADNKKYLSISRLFQFVIYLRQQLSEKASLPSENTVIFDISFDSIKRTVLYRDNVFDLLGDTIVIKNSALLPVSDSVPEFIFVYAQEFVEKYAA